MELVSPKYLYILYKLPPIMVMDFFACVHDSIQTIHQACPLVEAKNCTSGQNVLEYVVYKPTHIFHQLRLRLDAEHLQAELFIYCDCADVGIGSQ